jgi:hypothetical protein
MKLLEVATITQRRAAAQKCKRLSELGPFGCGFEEWKLATRRSHENVKRPPAGFARLRFQRPLEVLDVLSQDKSLHGPPPRAWNMPKAYA